MTRGRREKSMEGGGVRVRERGLHPPLGPWPQNSSGLPSLADPSSSLWTHLHSPPDKLPQRTRGVVRTVILLLFQRRLALKQTGLFITGCGHQWWHYVLLEDNSWGKCNTYLAACFSPVFVGLGFICTLSNCTLVKVAPPCSWSCNSFLLYDYKKTSWLILQIHLSATFFLFFFWGWGTQLQYFISGCKYCIHFQTNQEIRAVGSMGGLEEMNS